MPTLRLPTAVDTILPGQWSNLRPHPVQKSLWHSTARFVCVPAGRRSGKTELAKRRLVRYLPVYRGHDLTAKYAYLAPTRDQAKKIAWEDLKKLVPPAWLAGPPSETELVIRTVFNSELHVIGMDKPQRFEGQGWDGVVEDEASDQRPNIHLSIRPALADRQGWWWKIGVPKRQGIGARRYREDCERGFSGENPGHCTYTWPSTTVLPESEIEQLRQDLDEKDFNEQILAAWETVGGSAFHAFDAAAHVRPVNYDPSRPILVASDFNVDPMAWCLAQATPDGSGLEVFDELWIRNTNTQKTLDLLWDRYGQTHKGGFFFYGDASGRARRTSASTSDYAQIKNDKRFKSRVVYPAGNPAIKDRLSSCNALFRNAAGVVRCWISPRCEQLIADLTHRGLDKHGLPVEANSDGGHMTDAYGYLVHSRWPSTRVVSEGTMQIGVYQGE